MPQLWGEDLDLEVPRALLFARGDRHGWCMRFIDPSEGELTSAPTMRPWRPAFVTFEQSVILQLLCIGESVRMDDAKLLNWLQERGIKPEVLRDNLLETGLVAMRDQELQLITRNCLCAILSSVEFVAAENSTGRFTRWIVKQASSALILE